MAFRGNSEKRACGPLRPHLWILMGCWCPCTGQRSGSAASGRVRTGEARGWPPGSGTSGKQGQPGPLALGSFGAMAAARLSPLVSRARLSGEASFVALARVRAWVAV